MVCLCLFQNCGLHSPQKPKTPVILLWQHTQSYIWAHISQTRNSIRNAKCWPTIFSITSTSAFTGDFDTTKKWENYICTYQGLRRSKTQHNGSQHQPIHLRNIFSRQFRSSSSSSRSNQQKKWQVVAMNETRCWYNSLGLDAILVALTGSRCQWLC